MQAITTLPGFKFAATNITMAITVIIAITKVFTSSTIKANIIVAILEQITEAIIFDFTTRFIPAN